MQHNLRLTVWVTAFTFALASIGFAADDHLQLTEIVVTPTGGEFVEIHNPTDHYIDLADVYLTDATFSGDSVYYYKIVTGVLTDAGGGGFSDFHARFPAGAVIAPGEYQTVALNGSVNFTVAYPGVAPTYELYEDGPGADEVPDMREALPGSINNQGGLTNGGEAVILYHWDGASDLVDDLDYAIWVDGGEAVDKSGVSIDGPDADATTSTYLDDTAIASQIPIAGAAHNSGESWERIDDLEGAEIQAGGNGITGNDETSENLSTTWTTAADANPSTGPAEAARLLVSEFVVTPTAGEFIEIFNPNDFPVDLSDMYITDATYQPDGTFYYNIVTGNLGSAGGGSFGDFHARFPDGATIGSGEYQTVALAGSTGFSTEYGQNPTYELWEDDASADAVPDMREALPGSINLQGGLTNGGEIVVLYHWDGQSDLVGDVDYVIWGDTAEAVDKTGVAIDGPDAGVDTSTYLDDTAIANQAVMATVAHAFGMSFTRIDVDEGAEVTTDGNGIDTNDETSEDTNNTWGERDPSPNTGNLVAVALYVDDVSVLEGDAGTTTCTFTVSLSKPAPTGGVSFDVSTADGTASTDDSDYDHKSVTDAIIAQGLSSYSFDVIVNGDTKGEGNETFLVQISNVVGNGAVIDDNEGIGTILNDDPVAINVIQGSGLSSPLEGSTVFTGGNVVTAVGPVGFFMQTPDASADPWVNTSEGIYVFSAGPPGVSLGDMVDVSATVDEFYDFTELTGATVTVTSSGNPLPSAVAFDATTPSPDPYSPSCEHEYECYEGMLVSASGLVVGPTQTFNGDPVAEFFGIATSGPRPPRAIGAEYPPMEGLPPSVPIFDGNPEIFEIDPDKLGNSNVEAKYGDTFSAFGPLGYEYSGWEIWASTPVVLTPGPDVIKPVDEAMDGLLTVGSLNMWRMYDDVDDPGTHDDTTTVSTVRYQARLTKLALYITQVLRSPDVLAVQEVEQLSVLTDLAAKISTLDASVVYTPYLEAGNGLDGLDVGYLVRAADVQSVTITQLAADETITPEGYLLHDRPPLLLEGVYTGNAVTSTFSFAVLNNHTRSLGGVDDPANDFARRKRLQQAQSIAQIVQDYQTTNPTSPLWLVGDYNAFEFTDGYVDLLGQIMGVVTPSDNLLSEATITDPTMVAEVFRLPAADRYSYVFNGTAQVFDHALSTEAARKYVADFQYGRGNADSAESLQEDDSTAGFSTDHDGLVLYVDPQARIFWADFEVGDLSEWSMATP